MNKAITIADTEIGAAQVTMILEDPENNIYVVVTKFEGEINEWYVDDHFQRAFEHYQGSVETEVASAMMDLEVPA
jgi:hypothetical protein